MNIYKKLIIDIESGRILEEDSFEYSGPLALCGGGSSAPAPPAKTKTEEALDQQQLDMLKKQDKYQQELEPFTLESMGLMRDDKGVIVKSNVKTAQELLNEKNLAMQGVSPTGGVLTEGDMLAKMTDAEKMDYQVNKLTKQRQMDALEGKLAVSPALEEELNSEQTQAEEVLQRKLGKDWMLSTPGQSLMAKIKQKANLVREESRRGLITTAEGLSASQENRKALKLDSANNVAQNTMAAQTDRYNKMMGLTQSATMGYDVSSDISSKYADERMNDYNYRMQRYNQSQQQSNANMQAGMSAVGIAAAAAAAA
jgi:hypothetical protein